MNPQTSTYLAWAQTVAPFESTPTAPMLGFDKQRLIECLAIVAVATDILDHVKKACFYGRPMPSEHDIQQLLKSIQRLAEDGERPVGTITAENPLPGEAQGMRLFHGLLGRITETGELCAALVDVLSAGGAIDTTNVVEELGDGMVYDLYTLKALGVSFDTMLEVNASKLCKRFGSTNSFNAADANNRDLAGERDLMESVVQAR